MPSAVFRQADGKVWALASEAGPPVADRNRPLYSQRAQQAQHIPRAGGSVGDPGSLGRYRLDGYVGPAQQVAQRHDVVGGHIRVDNHRCRAACRRRTPATGCRCRQQRPGQQDSDSAAKPCPDAAQRAPSADLPPSLSQPEPGEPGTHVPTRLAKGPFSPRCQAQQRAAGHTPADRLPGMTRLLLGAGDEGADAVPEDGEQRGYHGDRDHPLEHRPADELDQVERVLLRPKRDRGLGRT
jgi:hypothetical protein